MFVDSFIKGNTFFFFLVSNLLDTGNFRLLAFSFLILLYTKNTNLLILRYKPIFDIVYLGYKNFKQQKAKTFR